MTDRILELLREHGIEFRGAHDIQSLTRIYLGLHPNFAYIEEHRGNVTFTLKCEWIQINGIIKLDDPKSVTEAFTRIKEWVG